MSGARDVANRVWNTLAARCSALRCRSPGTRRCVDSALSRPPVLCASGSSALAGGGGRDHGARTRTPGTRDPRCKGGEWRSRPTQNGLGRSLSRPDSDDATRGSKRARLRTPELAETRPGRAWVRRAVVGRLVRRLADGGGAASGAGPCFRSPHLARANWVAAIRTNRHLRSTASGPLSATRDRSWRSAGPSAEAPARPVDGARATCATARTNRSNPLGFAPRPALL
jgi:hypothetical protein